ncbi:MAG: GNAT family N-acetyltransferase [Rhodopseudomonas sp.]|uniref:GNAT family N-acetyltransferase n=1 Tax=Rhodopseudomonas sp. TaxID=1078 RepID=UPI00178E21B3|nr:GNAT family N-acetyltransferase [Rhodopseudomonas sp.]NVN84629.1 GNAT family N-acetyltransferase [Rhodopseudomonas sp.]
MTRSLPWRIEDACFNAWPALRSVYHGDWLLRFGEGVSRRSNSVNPLRAEAASIAAQIPLFTELYRAQKLPLIVRVPALLGPQVDRELDHHDFTTEGETCTLHGDLAGRALAADPAVTIEATADAEWLAAISALQKQTPTHAATYARVVAVVALPAGFAALRRDGEIVATAYGAIQDRLLCCESVVVSEAHRGEGLGARMMTALFAWAASRGAEAACLQVEASNVAGRALYRSIKLDTELHRYHYRRAPAG